MLRIFVKTLISLTATNHDNRNIKKEGRELSTLIGKDVVAKIAGYGWVLTAQYYGNAGKTYYEQLYYIVPTGGNLSEKEYIARRVANSVFVREMVHKTLNLAAKGREVNIVIKDEYAERTKEILTSENFKDVNEQELEMLIKLI